MRHLRVGSLSSPLSRAPLLHFHSHTQLGFFGILAVEALTGKGIFEMLGFKVGQGLGFEF